MLIEDERELHIRGVMIDWDRIDPHSYLRNIQAIAGVNSLSFHKPITFFVGENGSGKSTLLEAIAVSYGFNPEGGTKNYSFSTYDSHSQLHDAMRLIKGRFKQGIDIEEAAGGIVVLCNIRLSAYGFRIQMIPEQ
ncbi:MAG: AAA family ATPase [Lachnospiraceae bacterium]|nr:AAA family ATPase [Lachnospiraceae bacterium]